MELTDLKDKDNDDKDISVGAFLINLKENTKRMTFNFITKELKVINFNYLIIFKLLLINLVYRFRYIDSL